jgi:transposase
MNAMGFEAAYAEAIKHQAKKDMKANRVAQPHVFTGRVSQRKGKSTGGELTGGPAKKRAKGIADRARILEMMQPETPYTTRQVATAIRVHYNSASQHLNQLEAEGKVRAIPRKSRSGLSYFWVKEAGQ